MLGNHAWSPLPAMLGNLKLLHQLTQVLGHLAFVGLPIHSRIDLHTQVPECLLPMNLAQKLPLAYVDVQKAEWAIAYLNQAFPTLLSEHM